MIKLIKSFQSEYKRFANEQAVLIYQMGKVGSTSLDKSIKNAIHLHTLFIDNHPCKARQSAIFGFGAMRYWRILRQRIVYFIRRVAIKRRNRVKVITLVRPPLERNISMFFQDIDAYLFDNSTKFLSQGSPISMRFSSDEELESIFNESFEHEYPLKWFDNEFLRMWGLDIYQEPFDKALGYCKISKGNVDMLCLDMKLLNQNQEIIANFVGKPFNLVSGNIGQEKWYAGSYRMFKKHYKVNSRIRELLERSKYYMHFFDQEK